MSGIFYGGFQFHVPAFHFQCAAKAAFFPLFAVAYEAHPFASAHCLKHLFVIARSVRFQTEHFNQCSRFLVKLQAGADDFRIVENEQFAFVEIMRQIVKTVIYYFAVAIYKKFWRISFLYRIFGYALVGQRIVVILNLNVSRICHCFFYFGCKISDCFRSGTQRGTYNHAQSVLFQLPKSSQLPPQSAFPTACLQAVGSRILLLFQEEMRLFTSGWTTNIYLNFNNFRKLLFFKGLLWQKI